MTTMRTMRWLWLGALAAGCGGDKGETGDTPADTDADTSILRGFYEGGKPAH